MKTVRIICLGIAGVGLLPLVAGLAMGNADWWQPAAVASCVALAIGLGALEGLKGYQFTAWIIVAVVAAMIYPERFLHVGPIDLGIIHVGPIELRNRWIILIIVQAVMFGMGTQMSLQDFAGVARMPWGVFVGIFCQFTIMPLVGFALTKLFQFPPEIAAGIVLIGSCSSGLASNVMVYLARGNLALSITLVAVATMVAPIMTPLWMKLLAGQLVEVRFADMMIEIIKIVVVPIGAALLHDYLRHASRLGRHVVWGTAVLGMAWLAFLAVRGWDLIASSVPSSAQVWISLPGFLLGAVVVGVLYHALTRRLTWLDGAMPVLSMFGIVYFTAVTTAAGRDALLQIGGLLLLAAVIHNTAGYCFGYGLSRAMGLDRNSARTVAFEVGLQNGGMASGLAGAMGKLGTMGLAAAIFSPWMNVSGSILANYWRKRSAQPGAKSPSQEELDR